MANENAKLKISEIDSTDPIDFDELETKLQSDLDSHLSELEFLKEDRDKIGSPENLGSVVMNVVWEQFLSQMAAIAGEDFIEENRGLTLDLRNDAHIQTTDNFADGKIATHNDKIDYQKRYDDWQDNFKKDDNGNIATRTDKTSKTKKAVLKEGYREPFDAKRDKGSAAVNKDHTVSAAEIIRDPQANAHLEKQAQVDFANSDINLMDLDASANKSKGDSTMSDWLDSERNGEKPADRFNINEEECRENDKTAREEYEKVKKEGEQKSIEAGKQSQREEAFRITGKALRAVAMQFLAELLKEVISKLVSWLRTAKKDIESLLGSIKSAIKSFINKLKSHLINAGSTIVTTIATAIYGPIVSTIRKVFTMLKQGWRSLKDAIDYLKSPSSKNKPVGRLILEVGKIVIAGLSATGALALGEVIEKGLITIPVFAFEIPILGSLASLLGLFLGGVVSGIIGAIAISLIDKAIAKQQKDEAAKKEIDKGNEVLNTQNAIIDLNEEKLVLAKYSVASKISERHKTASNIAKDAMRNIFCEDRKNEIVVSENEIEFEDLLNDLNKLSE